jgi:hypothetical protein
VKEIAIKDSLFLQKTQAQTSVVSLKKILPINYLSAHFAVQEWKSVDDVEANG